MSDIVAKMAGNHSISEVLAKPDLYDAEEVKACLADFAADAAGFALVLTKGPFAGDDAPAWKSPAASTYNGGLKAPSLAGGALLSKFKPGFGWGVRCGAPSPFKDGTAHLVVLDVDVKDEADRPAIMEALRQLLGPDVASAPTVTTGSGGFHYWLRWTGDLPMSRGDLWTSGRKVPGTGKWTAAVEIKSTGTYVVGAGSPHPTGRAYRWSLSEAAGVRLHDVPESLRAAVAAYEAAKGRSAPAGAGDIEASLRAIASGAGGVQMPAFNLPALEVTTIGAPGAGTVTVAVLTGQSAFAGAWMADLELVEEALNRHNPDADYPDWRDLLFSLVDAGGRHGDPRAYELARTWSMRGRDFDQRKFDVCWHSYGWDKPNRIKVGTLLHGVKDALLPGEVVFSHGTAKDALHARIAKRKAAPAAVPASNPPTAPAVPAPAAPVTAAGPALAAPSVGAVLTCASDITPRAVDWAWRGWLACSMVHLLAGAPGTGKTTIALALVAAVTTGGRWPDGSAAPLGSAVIWSGEDSPEYTLVPRLAAMGANLARVQIVTGARDAEGLPMPFDPARDMAQLAAAVAAVGDVRLLILDPIVSAVTGDSHKATEVRRALQPIVDLAAQIGAAVLGITHLAKGTAGRDPTERVLGSVSFAAVVRLVMMAARVKGEDGAPDVRVLVRSKSNIGPDDGGFEYSLAQAPVPGNQEISASTVTWGKAITGSAKEIMKEPTVFDTVDKDHADGLRSAEDFLRQVLAAGPVGAKAVETDAEGAGISWSTVKRAKTRMGVIARKDGPPVEGSKQPSWRWQLPQSEAAPGTVV